MPLTPEMSIRMVLKMVCPRATDARSLLPELIPDNPQADERSSKRGKEKKRRLLAYLRDHPEELRPFSRKLLQQASIQRHF
jgi:hypothetical protein